MKRRELTPEEKKKARLRILQVSTVGGIVMCLLLIMKPKMSLDFFRDWEIVVVSLHKRCMDFMLAYAVSLFFRFKSSKIQVIIVFVLSILFDELIEFNIDMEYLSDNFELYIAVVVFSFLCCGASGLDSFVSEKIEGIGNCRTKHIVKIVYVIFVTVLICGMIITNVLWLIKYYQTHEWFSLIPIE